MGELLAIALVCAATVPARDCTRATALDVFVAPVGSTLDCARRTQAMAAATGLPGDHGRYLKILCERRRTAVAVPQD